MRIRIPLAGAVLVAAAASFAPAASASTCEPPVVSTVCFAWGTACQYVPHDDGKYDPHALLCTVVM